MSQTEVGPVLWSESGTFSARRLPDEESAKLRGRPTSRKLPRRAFSHQNDPIVKASAVIATATDAMAGALLAHVMARL